MITCRCGNLHVLLQSTVDVCRGDILVPLNTRASRIMVQFDGLTHRTRRVGGAAAALLQVECTGLALIDWGAQALPDCADNIVAETDGAELAISLYEKYRQLQGRPRIAKPRMMKENGAKKRTAHTGSFRQQTQRTRGDAKKNNAAKLSRLF